MKLSETKQSVNLHTIVEGSLDAHKQDIQLFTTGHLNFSRFTKQINDQEQYVPKWQSFSKQPKARTPIFESEFSHSQVEHMADALYDFSLGSGGVFPAPFSSPIARSPESPIEELHKKSRKKKLLKPKLKYSARQSILSNQKPSTHDIFTTASENKTMPIYLKPVTSKVYVEELKLPELMLSPISSLMNFPPSVRAAAGPIKQSFEKKKFITTHLAGITSKDQYQKMIDLEENILQTAELTEKSACDGHKAITHLENKLVEKLLLLQMRENSSGPSFERLQIYSGVWSDMILDSSIFGELFSEIKDEYDSYFSYLLDLHKFSDRGDLLRSQYVIDDASTKEKSEKAETLSKAVEELEKKCRDALIKNYGLHQNINEELQRMEEQRRREEEEKRETFKKISPERRHGLYSASLAAVAATKMTMPLKMTKTKKLQNMRADIWKKLDMIFEIKQQLKNNFIPKTLYRNALRAIKDLETDIQKLRQQHAYLTQHKQELSDQIRRAFVKESVNAADAEKIWGIIEKTDTSTKSS